MIENEKKLCQPTTFILFYRPFRVLLPLPDRWAIGEDV